MPKFNKELAWLAETFGISTKEMSSNEHLSGAIYGKCMALAELVLKTRKHGERLRLKESITPDGRKAEFKCGGSIRAGTVIFHDYKDSLVHLEAVEGKFAVTLSTFIRHFC